MNFSEYFQFLNFDSDPLTTWWGLTIALSYWATGALSYKQDNLFRYHQAHSLIISQWNNMIIMQIVLDSTPDALSPVALPHRQFYLRRNYPITLEVLRVWLFGLCSLAIINFDLRTERLLLSSNHKSTKSKTPLPVNEPPGLWSGWSSIFGLLMPRRGDCTTS